MSERVRVDVVRKLRVVTPPPIITLLEESSYPHYPFNCIEEETILYHRFNFLRSKTADFQL